MKIIVSGGIFTGFTINVANELVETASEDQIINMAKNKLISLTEEHGMYELNRMARNSQFFVKYDFKGKTERIILEKCKD
jgi:hypothetical protein